MRAFSRYAKRGFTLVELMIVVAIIGVLAALAIFGVTRYLKSAKTSEAKNSLGAMARGAAEAFERESTATEQLVVGTSSTTATQALCGDSTIVPALPPQGKKYAPNNTTVDTDFNSGTSTSGWKCLKFQMDSPMYYQYKYTNGPDTLVPAPAPQVLVTVGFTAFARGDLDGDGTNFSTFAATGQITAAGATKQLVRSSQIYAANEFD